MNISANLFSVFHRSAAIAAIVLASTSSANAHLGHVGELAGHGHLVGVGLVGTAVMLGGILAAASRHAKGDHADTPVADDADEQVNGTEDEPQNVTGEKVNV
ncbi:MAG: DUF6732 family protein [Alphaproteobacteria bacterium]